MAPLKLWEVGGGGGGGHLQFEGWHRMHYCGDPPMTLQGSLTARVRFEVGVDCYIVRGNASHLQVEYSSEPDPRDGQFWNITFGSNVSTEFFRLGMFTYI